MASTLISKIAAASTKVGALMPDKTNTAQNYSYISADKILQRAGDALAEAGVVIIPSITKETVNEVTYTDSYNKTKTRYDAIITFEMLISDGTSEFKAPWTGRGSDFSVPDKAMYKAITSGHKYFIAKLLNIGVGNEDGEHEAVQDAPKTTQKPVDVVFDKPAMQLATKEQLKRLGDLGAQYYGAEWAEQLPKLVEAVTRGATSDVSQLQPSEANKLIAGINKKLAQSEVVVK